MAPATKVAVSSPGRAPPAHYLVVELLACPSNREPVLGFSLQWMQTMYAHHVHLRVCGSNPETCAAVFADYARLYGTDAVGRADFEAALQSPEFAAALARIFDARPAELFTRINTACTTPVELLRALDHPIDHICAVASGLYHGASASDVEAQKIADLEGRLIRGAVAFQATSTALITTKAELEVAKKELATARDNEDLARLGETVACGQANAADDRVSALEDELAKAKDKLAKMRSDHETELAKMRADHETELKRLEAEDQRAATATGPEAKVAALEKKLRVAEVSLQSADLRWQTAANQAAQNGDKCAELEGWAKKLVAMATQDDQVMAPLELLDEVKRYGAAAAAAEGEGETESMPDGLAELAANVEPDGSGKSRSESPLDHIPDDELVMMSENGVPVAREGCDSPPRLWEQHKTFAAFVESDNGKVGVLQGKSLPGKGKPANHRKRFQDSKQDAAAAAGN